MVTTTEEEFNYQRIHDLYQKESAMDVFFARKEIRNVCQDYFKDRLYIARKIVHDVDKSYLKRLAYAIGMVPEFNRQKYKAAKEMIQK